jgi:tetratricopeptide (TPR) repeat protein
MSKAMHRGCLLVSSVCVFAGIVTAAPPAEKKPLNGTKLLALVAGNALPENIVAEVAAEGLSFTPSEEYRAQLAEAGATKEVLNSVSQAKVQAGEAEETKREQQSWPHLAEAGKLIRAERYEEAETELNEALKGGGAKLATGFVMGEALRRQEEWTKSAAVYAEIIREDENFPEAQTKLSYLLYRTGDAEESLRAAKAALAATPNNAEAHKNAGLALESVQKYDASAAEYREALRIKPDYAYALYDLGLLLYKQNNFDGAIAEYKKAVTLDPNNIDTRVNLSLAYDGKNDGDRAIRELREAKKLAPRNFDVRQRLGSMLLHYNMDADAVTELRELEAMAPESAVCHLCLGSALYRTTDYEGAKKEFQTAIRLDPADPTGYEALGRTYEAQEKDVLALEEYRQSERINPDSVETRLGMARILLRTKQPKLAREELKTATELEPGNATVHEQYGRALEAEGDDEQAKSEYKEALLLDKENAFALLDLAALLEKQGDWAGAMENYRTADRMVRTAILSQRGPHVVADAMGAYKAAQLRFEAHLSQLRAAGKSGEAAALEAKNGEMQVGAGVSQKLDAAMEAGNEAFQQQRYDEAERSYKEAVKLAEQVKPHDARLVMSLGFLGGAYYNRKDLADSQATIEQQLKAAEEVYGPDSPQLSQVLEAMARMSLELGDTAKAESFAQQGLKLNEKNTGDNSMAYSMSLMTVGYVYYTEKQYEKAAIYLEKAVKIHENLTGPQAIWLVGSEKVLCMVYDAMDKPAKAEACNHQLLTLMEKFYGANNPALAPALTSEARALRALGREAEAVEVEKRLQSLQQPVAGTN